MKQSIQAETSKTERPSSRYSSITNQDILSLSLYIKNVSTSLENLNSQLSLSIGNRSLINSQDIINESENDDETKLRTTSSSVNPFKRASKPKLNQPFLLSSSYLKDKPSSLNKTSITDDSLRESSCLKPKTNLSFAGKEIAKQIKTTTNEKADKASNCNKNAFLPLKVKGFHLKTKPSRKQHIKALKTTSKVKEELNLMSKYKAKGITNSITHSSKEQFDNKKANTKMGEAQTLKQQFLKVNNKSKPSDKEFAILNDKALLEMFLLFSEMTMLNSNPQTGCSCNKGQKSYFQEMKTSYLIRNSDSFKAVSFREAYNKDRKSIAALIIQNHWRKWKINSLFASTDDTCLRDKRNQTKAGIVKNGKVYFFNNTLLRDVDYLEMINMMKRANDCYKKCLDKQIFVDWKCMLLTDFIH